MADRRLGARLHALADVLRWQAQPWRAEAACRGRTAVMYGGPQQREAAVAICASCPVLEPCRSAALAGPERMPGGVVGGLTEAQRRRLRARARPLDASCSRSA